MAEQLESFLAFIRAVLDCTALLPDFLAHLLGGLLWIVALFLEAAFYYFVFAAAISPINLYVSHVTSKVAGQHIADPDYWFWVFLIFPGVGQMLFSILYFGRQVRYRIRLRQQDLFGLFLWARYLEELLSRRDRVDSPVTPFGESAVESLLEVARWPTAVLNDWHDAKIDELIEWKQWRKAFERTMEQLRKARLAGDRRSVEIYRAYAMLLLPYVDSERFNRLLMACSRKENPAHRPMSGARLRSSATELS